MYDKIAQKLIENLNLPSEIFEIDFENLNEVSKDDKNIVYELKVNHMYDFKGHFYINHFKENRESIGLLIKATEISQYLEAINEVLAENEIEIIEEELKEKTFRNTDAEIFLAVIPTDKDIVEIHLTRRIN